MNQPSPVPIQVRERSTPSSPNPAASAAASVARDDRRRLGERASVSLDATVFRGAELRLTRTLDLSSTGCALQACAEPLSGYVTLQLVANSGEVLRVQARFKRSHQGADAYEFVDLDDTDRLTIAEIIDTFHAPDH